MITLPTFKVAFSTITNRSTVHADWCEATSRKRGIVECEIDADTPEQAASIYAEENELVARGFKRPTICACARR